MTARRAGIAVCMNMGMAIDRHRLRLHMKMRGVRGMGMSMLMRVGVVLMTAPRTVHMRHLPMIVMIVTMMIM